MLEIRISHTTATSDMSVIALSLDTFGDTYGTAGWVEDGLSATGGGGTGFAGRYYISTDPVASGSVTEIEITNGGSGYTSTPTIVFNNPPGATTATATATVAETFFVSDSGHSGANFGAETGSSYYREFVKTPPVFTLGPTKGGWIHVQSGTITLVNRPFDPDHPFGNKHFSTLLTNTGNANARPIIEIKDGTKYPLFRGTMALTKLTPTDLSFTLQGKKYDQLVCDTVTAIFRPADNDSTISQADFPLPWSHGNVKMQGNILCRTANVSDPEIYNPDFDPNETIEVWSVASAAGTAGEEFFDSTHTDPGNGRSIIQLTGTEDPTVRQYRLNGVGRFGTVLQSFFQALLYYTSTRFDGTTQFGLPIRNISLTKAPNVADLDVTIYQTDQILNTDLAGEVAQAVNYQYFIHVPTDGSTYGGEETVIIDRANAPTATELADTDVESVSLNLGAPLKAVVGNVSLQEGPYAGLRGIWQRDYKTTLRSENLDYGKTLKVNLPVQNWSEISDYQTVVDAIRDVEKKPTASIRVKGIQSSYMPGDRFTANREEDHVKVTLTVRSLTFDWKSRTTTISGDCELSLYEDE